MSTIFKLAHLDSSDYPYVRNADQELLYAGAQQYISMANMTTMNAVEALVGGTTEIAKGRFKKPATGRMQKASEISSGKAVAPGGSWDVAFPLENYHEVVAISDVDVAYMTPDEFQLHIDGVITRSRNSIRHEILYNIFNENQKTFVDKRLGSLTIEPLANGDSVTYPPVEGSDTEAAEDHYLESGYAASAISDTNNPYETIVNDLVHHGLDMTDDIPCVAFIHPDEQSETEALTNFVPYIPPQIVAGNDTDTVLMPGKTVPGKVIGYIRGLCWVSVWRWIPSGYIVGVNLATEAPLKMRVDPAETGLGNGGLVLLPEERYGQLTFNSWRLRFGIGAWNRLSGVVMELGTGGTYTTPSAYA